MERYDYKNLKKELEKTGESFKTNSDTEVILRLFDKFGVESLKNYLEFCCVHMG